MKKTISLILALMLTVMTLGLPASAAAQTKSLDEIFDSQIGSLDYFHSLDPSYMAFRVSRDLYVLYLPDDLGEDEYQYPISAEIYENYLFTLFEVSDATLNSVKACASYNEADDTYMLEYIGGFGGSLAPREYQGFTDNGDGTYCVYYATINYLYLPDSEYENAEALDWPSEYEYDGKIYENGPDGYVHTAGTEKSGRKYTVEYNEETGIVRFIKQENYTEADLPESFDSATVPSVVYYEMRHDLGVSFDIGDDAKLGGATVSASKLTNDIVGDAMKDIAENYCAYDITATKDWSKVSPKAEIKVTFDIPEGYENPQVYLVSNARAVLKLASTIDKENGKITATTGAFGTFIVCDAFAPSYVLGDVNGNGEIEKYDYILVKRAVLNTIALDETQLLAADVNKKDGVEKYDYILVKRHVLKTFTIEG